MTKFNYNKFSCKSKNEQIPFDSSITSFELQFEANIDHNESGSTSTFMEGINKLLLRYRYSNKIKKTSTIMNNVQSPLICCSKWEKEYDYVINIYPTL